MSYSVQSGGAWAPYGTQQIATEDLLRHEMGWTDVASGLAKILFGYFLIFVNVMLILFLVVFLAFNAHSMSNPNSKTAIIAMWVLFLGCGIIFLLSLYTYVTVFVGKCRCAIHAPERCGARWYIFACMLCIVIGPVMGFFDTASAMLGPTNAQKDAMKSKMFQRVDQQEKDAEAVLAELRKSIGVTQIAGALVSLATTVFFVLFLRSIGNCFEDSRLSSLSDLYLMFTALLMGFTIFLVFFAGLDRSTWVVLLILGIGGLVSIAWYIGLIVYTRCLILYKLENLGSPLEAK